MKNPKAKPPRKPSPKTTRKPAKPKAIAASADKAVTRTTNSLSSLFGLKPEKAAAIVADSLPRAFKLAEKIKKTPSVIPVDTLAYTPFFTDNTEDLSDAARYVIFHRLVSLRKSGGLRQSKPKKAVEHAAAPSARKKTAKKKAARKATRKPRPSKAATVAPPPGPALESV